jgi:hypothetical protein
MICSISDVGLVDFASVNQTSQDTVRKSIDQTKFVLSWDGDQPTFISTLTSPQGPYTNPEVLSIMGTPEWTESY